MIFVRRKRLTPDAHADSPNLSTASANPQLFTRGKVWKKPIGKNRLISLPYTFLLPARRAA
jgi:hypothetical protein